MATCVKCETRLEFVGFSGDEKCPACGWIVFFIGDEIHCRQCGRDMDRVKGYIWQCPRCQKRIKI